MTRTTLGRAKFFAAGLILATLPVLAAVAQSAAPGAGVDGAKIANADADPGEWFVTVEPIRSSASLRSTRSTHRTSSLSASPGNIGPIPSAASKRRRSSRRRDVHHAPWSKVIALDAKTGKELWTV